MFDTQSDNQGAFMKKKYDFFSDKLETTKYDFWTKFRQAPSSSNATFQLKTLAKLSKAGFFATLVGCTLLYGWDQYEQHKTRVIFDSTKPKGHTTLEKDTALTSKDLDTWDYSKENNLVQRYGPGAMVKIGGGKKEGFRGIIPLPAWLQPSEELRSKPLEVSDVCHVGIVIEPVDGDKESRPLIIGRQSPMGPLPTLKSAIEAGWKQYTNPTPGLTITSVMTEALKTTIANESPHIAKGTSFDTTVIHDLTIPIEFVEQAIKAAEEDLNPVMTFAWDNCITTKTYVLLKLARSVDEWAESGKEDAPTREKANKFITGCYTIISDDMHRGYGTLNNAKIAHELEDFGKVTKRIGHDDENKEAKNKSVPTL